MAYIDESGDDGVASVRPIDPNGASEWFVLSALVVRAEAQGETVWVRDILKQIRLEQRRTLHFQPLDDWRRAMVCASIAKLPVRCFAVISNKANRRAWRLSALRGELSSVSDLMEKTYAVLSAGGSPEFVAGMHGYRNKKAEAASVLAGRTWFYWWITRLLLERVAVIELVIGAMWLFGTVNPAVFAVLTIGLPVLALTVALPIVLLIRSNRSSTQNRPPSNLN
ncbi:DUF3800 domain-containing protein [Bradyrhizobium sp. th.b2]|uniref:DUF3800 domain-containing protein n=1 Tax=Bradyrhizobium sp. th-b2 TaxID=172088 RepID=UPI001FDAB778|nr:DUF3800 domain-containing protein [Bradyrhizobium sp. th.b2]